PGQEYDVSLWSFDSGSSAPRVSDWTEVSGPEPVAIETSYTFDGTEPPTSDFAATMSAKLTASATGELRIQGVRNGGTSFGVFLNAIQVVAPTLEAAIVTDISAQMGPTDTSALLRIPFPYPADFAPDELHLDVAYDSGFVAYLNGTEIARRNAPADPVLPYDATAQSERTVSAALTTERIDLSSVSSLLAVGDNVLAFQALNSGAGDFDFLLNPQLTAIQYGATTSRYFSQPTPGAENLGETFLGVVADPEFSIKRGFYTEPQSLTIHSDSPGASIIYTLDGSLPTPTHGTRVDAASPQTMPDATVTISTTSYVRALVVQDEYLSTAVETQTYIFLDDVLNQTIEPAVGEPVYPATWQSTAYRADYNMDPDVVATWDDNNPANTDTGIREALLSIPTMSIVMDHDDLWGSRAGIYPRAQSQGTIWQRAGSLEYIDPVSGDQFQVNAGVQMHGGASRDNERTKKHSFRLLFNERFGGPSELNYPLFGDSSLESINTFVLKSFFTDGFPTRTATGRYSPLDSQYMRDTWMRDVRNAMGGLDAHSDYVHLYINGLYWGLYSPTERPDDAFAAAYLGGERDDFDIVKDFNELFRGNKTAWNEMFAIANGGVTTAEEYQRIQGNNPDGTPNPELPNYLDVDDLIDYMILHLYAGAEDWPHHNWYSIRDRVGETKGFRFFTWDQEIVLDGRYRDRTNVSDAFTPARLYSQLRKNEDFQIRFADRVYKHLFNDGALTTSNAQASWMRRADQIEAAIIAESARWGDAREGEVRQIDNGGPMVTIPVMTVDLWRAERDNVRDNYFARSLELAVQRFTADKLFPTLMPPQFAQRGGLVGNGQVILSGDGEIYYTLDGTDPRQLGGAISPQAIRYTGPISLPADSTVTVRAFTDTSWSAVDQATFEVNKDAASAANFRVTELHYHPQGDTNTEFIELQNVSATTISLTGVAVAAGVQFDFTDANITSLAAGEYVVIVEDLAAFATMYPTAVAQVAGEYAGSLSNGGDTIQVFAADGSMIQELTYDDDAATNWPLGPDGGGPSLQVIVAAVDCAAGAGNCNWRSSAVTGGTPGREAYPVGDANLDGIFNSADIVQIFQAGKYELTIDGAASWSQGDWNGDGLFITSDLVFAFQFSDYIAAAIDGAQRETLSAEAVDRALNIEV
ncbi:MAG: chitobiase/beta-hexosaminidase C-terminal domain-containing protein, partial [Planctomycetales bacterium]|nr:chitobiase/beta-hexosaminidase C-terminal domain-containing protein [Planctomycetales bacterium]